MKWVVYDGGKNPVARFLYAEDAEEFVSTMEYEMGLGYHVKEDLEENERM